MTGRRVAFWGAVAVTAVLANALVEVAASAWPQSGLAQFVAFTHKGVG